MRVPSERHQASAMGPQAWASLVVAAVLAWGPGASAVHAQNAPSDFVLQTGERPPITLPRLPLLRPEAQPWPRTVEISTTVPVPALSPRPVNVPGPQMGSDESAQPGAPECSDPELARVLARQQGSRLAGSIRTGRLQVDSEDASFYRLPRFFPPDAWKPKIGNYEVKLEEGASVAQENLRAYFDAADFNALRRASAAGGLACVVEQISTDADKERIRKILLSDQGGDARVVVFIVNLVSLADGAWPLSVAATLIDAASSLPSVAEVKKREEYLGAILSRGGRIVYQEALTAQSPYYLTRSLYYHVKVGEEDRVVLLWVARVPAEVKAPQK